MSAEEETWFEIRDVGKIQDKDQAIAALRELQENEKAEGSHEALHRNADAILCSLLISLGYEDVVREFAKIEKWYA